MSAAAGAAAVAAAVVATAAAAASPAPPAPIRALLRGRVGWHKAGAQVRGSIQRGQRAQACPRRKTASRLAAAPAHAAPNAAHT